MRTNRKLLTLVCAVIFTILPANAQRKYFDAYVYDLTGHVKEAQISYAIHKFRPCYHFDKEGRLVDENGDFKDVERDEKGYVIKVNASSDYFAILTYNSLHYVHSEIFLGVTTIYEYDKNKNLIKTYDEDNPEEGSYYVYTKFDDHGNWTERKEYDIKTQKYKDTMYRKITYWSNNPFK